MDEYYYEQKEIKIRQIVIIEQKGKAPYNTARNRPKLPGRPYSPPMAEHLVYAAAHCVIITPNSMMRWPS